MSFAIEMVEVEAEMFETHDLPATPTPQTHVVGPFLWSFLDQLNADQGLRSFGTRFFAVTLDKIEKYDVGTPLTNDQWWALRHGVIDRLLTARVHCKTNDMLVLKPNSMPGLRGTIFSASEARAVIKNLISPDAEEKFCETVISENYFRPQDFIGEFNLNDFK